MKTLFDKANGVIHTRRVWEQKQRLWYEMRHDGIRRKNKPWPAAADLHFPLVDMAIGKSKPFWEAQATSNERLAAFVALREQQQAMTTAAADFFDYELKQNTNFEVELIRAIDTMLMRGRGALKITVDPFNGYKLVHESVDPVYILMADGADDFEDADWFVHVMPLTVGAYKRNRRYNQSPAVIKRIVGNKELSDQAQLEGVKMLREGINYSADPNTIILFEHYEKTMGGWTIHTYSPQAAELAGPDLIRKPFGLPYKRAGKVSINFYSIKTEIKDKGWYSPRGLAELNAPFESYACKLWNEKTDAMTYSNTPVLTSDLAIPNTANMKWAPGEILPGALRGVAMPPPAFSFDQEMAFTRSVSEQRSRLPDFGIQQPGQAGQTGSARTATENNRISQLQTVGTDSDGRRFRMDLAAIYRHDWALILQFKREALAYYTGGELKQLPDAALHDAYLILPDGAPDQWNKQLRMQRSQQRFAMFKGVQSVDQDLLVRDTLATDDPKFALEAFIPTNIKAANESEDEAMEISIMQMGFPAMVKPDEDHATRIHILISWLQAQQHMGKPLDPTAKQRVQEHLIMHWQYLKALDPKAAQQLAQQIAQMEQQATQPGAGPGGPPGGPGPGGPGGPPSGPPPPPPGQQP